MPCLKIFTNLAKDKIPATFLSKLLPVLSQTVKKPENRIAIMITTDCIVCYGGQLTDGPGAVASLESIGHLGLEENKLITKKVTEVIHKELGIDPERFMLTFYDLAGQNVGKGGVILG